MKVKRLLAFVMGASFAAGMLTGCGSSGIGASSGSTSNSAAQVSGGAKNFSGQSIEVDIGGEMDDPSIQKFKEMTAAFAEQTGATIDVVTNGNDHEQVMKTKMASQSLPDVWSTHGWSTVRYNDFLLDLSDQPWASNMDDAVSTVVTDKNGKVCAMPMTEWIYGFIYNKDVLDANNIDPNAIKTWDDFFNACATLKKAGITPIVYNDKETGALAGYLEMLSSWYTIDNAPYPSNETLSDGTFDFTKNTECLETFAKLWDEGYQNTDLFTMDQDTSLRQLGNGTYAFRIWGSPQYVNTMQEYYPEGNFGIIPVPAVKTSSNAAYTVGEGVALGVSANTKNPDLCKAYLQYMNDNLADFIRVNGNLPGMKGIEVPEIKSIKAYTDSVIAAGDKISYCNFFDREYLPSGMWNIMEETMVNLYNGGGSASDQVASSAQKMQDNFVTLYGAK